MQGNVAVAVTGQAGRVRHKHPAEHKSSALNYPVDISADSGTIFVVVLFNHSNPFVLGTSVPTILTASASAWPSPLKIASAM